MVDAPIPGAVVIAAPASGNGKTTVATGLMAALAAGGRTVAPFKVGPDFIDPTFHGLATGRPGRSLDANLQGAARIAPLYAHGSAGADVSVIEGVMGLFDGRITHLAPDGVSGFGSTAHVAGEIGAPVLLVVDARGHSQSVAALVRGYATFAPGTHIAGVILNQIGSDRHTAILSDACESVGVPVFGAVPRDLELSVPSRHLGLMTPDALAEAQRSIAAMGHAMASHVDIDAVQRLAATYVEGWTWRADTDVEDATFVVSGDVEGDSERPVIAIARGPAFGFLYAEWVEMLLARGASIAWFDPRCDPLPESANALFLPGGYPEEHAAELEANIGTREQIRGAIDRGLPVYAECGGYAYLGRSLDGHAMVGVVAERFEFSRRLTLGYRDAVAITSSPMFEAGERVVGHEFHRTSAVIGEDNEAPGHAAAWGWRDTTAGTPVREGHVTQSIHGSYLHVHPAGVPSLVSRLVQAGQNFRLGG